MLSCNCYLAPFDYFFINLNFRHSVSSGYWKSYHLHHLNSTTLKTNDITIQMAIHAWIEASQLGGTVKFQDKCDGPRCNSQCPETVVLGELSPYWNVHFQFNILGVVVFVSLLCLMLKVGLSVYIKMIERQQNRFLKWNYYNKYEDSESVVSNAHATLTGPHVIIMRYCSYHFVKMKMRFLLLA